VLAETASGGAKILPFRRRWPLMVTAFAAAAALVLFALRRPTEPEALDAPPAGEWAMLGHLELLEVYAEMQVFDGLEDEETFELVAMLDTLDAQEAAQ